MKTKFLSLILPLLFLFGNLSSQTFDRQKLDSLFDVLTANHEAMGSLILVKNGEVVYNRSIGCCYISGDKKIPASTGSRYRIGSITKMFTATMIFQLVEEGKLSLGTTIDRYFPDLPNASKVTIANLLNHHSGIHSLTDDPEYTSWMTQPKTEDEILAIISKYKPDFEPGTKGEYSNSNYILLGYIIERVTGKSYAKNLKQRITSKAGLMNTVVGTKATGKNHECLSFHYADGWEALPETDMSIPGGAGDLVSTPQDLATFIRALFNLQFVSAESLDKMKTLTDGYGMGMFRIPFYEKRAYGHNGGIDGFASNLAWFPEDSLAMAYCTNGVVYPMNDILIGVLSIYFDRPYTIPSFKSVNLSATELEKFTGTWSSAQLPLKITITSDGHQLTARATGQNAFPLQAEGENRFTYPEAGIVMEFDTAKNQMTLKQSGGVYLFTKE